MFAPLSQVPSSHRGQTLVASVVNTCECRSTSVETSPVAKSAMPLIGAVSTLTRQTATPPAITGSGGPKVVPLSEPVPVGPFAVHVVVPAASQPLRQSFNCNFAGKGKLCSAPVQPRSRSVPWSSRVKTTSSGPPPMFFGQAASGRAPLQPSGRQPQSPRGVGHVVVVKPQPLFFLLFLQTNMNLSLSERPDPALAVTWIVSLCPSLTARAASAPHTCTPLSTLGGTRAALSTVMPVSAGTAHFFVGSSTHTEVWNVQLPTHDLWTTLFLLFVAETSVSHTSSPTQQSRVLSICLASSGARPPGSTRAE